MKTHWMVSTLVVCALVVTGCARMKVQKVPLSSRLNGTDENIKGFRYYLSRPYVVVDSRVPVTTDVDLTEVREAGGKKVLASILYPDAVQYDMGGHRIDPPLMLAPKPPASAARSRLSVTRNDRQQGAPVVQIGYEETLAPGEREIRRLKQLLRDCAGNKCPSCCAALPNVSDMQAVPEAERESLAELATQVDTAATAQNASSECRLCREPALRCLLILRADKVQHKNLLDEIDRQEGAVASLATCHALAQAMAASGQPVGVRQVANAYIQGAPPVQVVPVETQTTPDATTGGLQIPENISITLLTGVAPSEGDPQSAPKFQIVSLPDFEEQMAVQNMNFAAHGKYDLHFADGWQMHNVRGSWDSTEVPVRALQSISNLLSAAAEVQSHQLTTMPLTPQEIAEREARLMAAASGLQPGAQLVLITRERAIEPGMYRLRKWSDEAWMGSVDSSDVACGLLSEMGLPIVDSIKLEIVTK